MNIWIAIYRTTWVVLSILIVLSGILLAIPKMRHHQALQNNRDALEQGNLQMSQDVREHVTNQERFRTDDQFLVDVARDAGMVRSNELVFKFTNAPNPSR